jgi:DNA replication protein DnaC
MSCNENYQSEMIITYRPFMNVNLVINDTLSDKEDHSSSFSSSSSFVLVPSSFNFLHILNVRLSFLVSSLKTRELFSFTEPCQQTIIMSGPKGSGKSHYLMSLKDLYSNNNKSESITCMFVDLNEFINKTQELSIINNIEKDSSMRNNISSSSTIQNLKENQFETSLKYLFTQLFRLSSMEIDKIIKNNQNGQLGIILIDNLDIMLSLFSSSSPSGDEPTALSRSFVIDQYLRLLAYHLQVIFSYLRDDDCRKHKFLFIGTTSYLKSSLPRSHVGCPEFELFLSFSKPSFRDRCHLVYQQLSDLSSRYLIVYEELTSSFTGSFHEIENVFGLSYSSDSSSFYNRLIWSYQIAGLTRGYFPGDLQSMINKAYLLLISSIERRSIDHQHREDEDPGILSSILPWNVLLQAIAATPLKAIEDLEITRNYDYSSETSLSWKSFAGYSSVKKKIQTFLRPFLFPTDTTNNLTALSSSSSSFLNSFRLPRGMILYGPSGCGKSYLAKIISKEVDSFILFLLFSLLFLVSCCLLIFVR